MAVAVLDVGDSLVGGGCRRGRLDGGGVAMAMVRAKKNEHKKRRLKMQQLNNPPFPR